MGHLSKEGNSDYASIHPELPPGIHFRATGASSSELLPYHPSPPWISHLDAEKAPFDIRSQLRVIHFHRTPRQSVRPQVTLDPDGLLRHSDAIYVLNSGNLQLRVFSTHMTTPCRTFRSDEDPTQVRLQYYWPDFQSTSRNTANQHHLFPRQTVRHKPYGLLKQLPIPEKP